MTPIEEKELKEALFKAFNHAIQVVGFATFKATSLFKSNESVAVVQKLAA